MESTKYLWIKNGEKKGRKKSKHKLSLSPKNIKKKKVTTHNRKQTKTRELNIKIVMKNEKKKKKRLERGLFSVGDFFFFCSDSILGKVPKCVLINNEKIKFIEQ